MLKAIFSFMLSCLALITWVSPSAALVEMDFDKSLNSAGCVLPGLELPENAKVYVTGANAGEKTGWQIDQSGHEATLVKVAVNSPDAPVALMLSAYEPTIWQIGWTEGTRILAVVASGYHAQAVAGLPDEVPVLSSSSDNKGACVSFYNLGRRGQIPDNIDQLSRRLFGRSPEMPVALVKGQVIFGPPLKNTQKLYTARKLIRDDFQVPGTPLAGPMGLADAVRKGQLKPASDEEYQLWQRQLAKNSGIPDHLIPEKFPRSAGAMHRPYVVLDPDFIFPNGLYGGNSATFFLPPGLPLPKGDRGHSRVIFLEDGRSVGP